MKAPFFPPIAPGDIGSIVSLAIYELGLPEEFVLQAFAAAGGNPKKTNAGDWDLSQLGAYEWVWIANFLYIPVDSVSLGYVRMTQKKWVGDAILEGAFVLPITERTRKLFLEYVTDRVSNIRYEREHLGQRLFELNKKRRLQEAKERRKLRHVNYKFGEERKKRLLNIFQQTAQGSRLPTPRFLRRAKSKRTGLPREAPLHIPFSKPMSEHSLDC